MLRRKGNFFMVLKEAAGYLGWSRTLGNTAKDLLFGLISEANVDGYFAMSIAEMAEKLGTGRTVTSNALNELIRAGIVERGKYQAQYHFSREFIHHAPAKTPTKETP